MFDPAECYDQLDAKLAEINAASARLSVPPPATGTLLSPGRGNTVPLDVDCGCAGHPQMT